MRVQVPPRGLSYICYMRVNKKERRATRRREKATVRDANVNDLLEMLNQGNKPAGFYDPISREAVLFPGADESVREHELVHATQFGPLRALLNIGRVQDKQTRESMRAITKDMAQEDYDMLGSEGFSPLKYMIDDPKEFEAIISSAVNSPTAQGINFNQGFDQILESLNALPEDETNTNIRLLRSAMAEGNLSDRQKDFFMKAVRSNLRS